MRRNPLSIMFFIVPILMVLMMIWQYNLYQECRSDGYKAYVCMAMLNKGHYIWFDQVDGGK